MDSMVGCGLFRLFRMRKHHVFEDRIIREDKYDK